MSRCLRAVVPQLDEGDEAILAVDGPMWREGPAATDDQADVLRSGRVRIVDGPPVGPGGARNRGLAAARGDLILFLNDDVTAAPDLLEVHRREHAARERAGAGNALIVGSAPWATPEEDCVIDRLVRDTSLVFFYDQMTAGDPDRDWGFRHAWTLNLSIPRASVPPFDERLRHPMFDDLEWAYRATAANDAGARLPVLHRPTARVTHHHRYTPELLLAREALLGHQAPLLHRIAPDCGRATFGARYHPRACDPIDRLTARDAGAPAAAREAYARFANVAGAPVTPAWTDAAIQELFVESRLWRDVARDFGCAAAVAGRSTTEAQRDAIDRVAGEPQPDRDAAPLAAAAGRA